MVVPVRALALACLLILAACGEDKAPKPPQESVPQWSVPGSVPQSVPVHPGPATGDPDGAGPSGLDAAGALRRLRERVKDGRAALTAAWEEDLRVATELLFDVAAPSEALRVHLDTVRIASEVSGWMHQAEPARAQWIRDYPTDVALHDAFLAQSEAGVERYREWCAGPGRELLRTHAQARQDQWFGKR